MKKKLLIFHPALAPYRVDFFNALNHQFDAVFYFSFRNVQDQKFDQEHLLSQINFNPNYLEKGFSLAGRAFRFGILSLIHNKKPSIVLCSEYGQITLISFIYYLLHRKKFKLYTICDDSIENSKDRKYIRALVRNIISKNIDGVIYASKEVGIWNVQHVSKKINPLELPIIHQDDVFREKLIDSLPVASEYIKKYGLFGKKIILFVGRLVKVKNIPSLLNAYAQAGSDSSVLVIVGSGPLETQLKKIAVDNHIWHKVIFTGRLEGATLNAWFTLAHLFLLTSTYEPFGAVINEALLAGCQVICSNKAGAVTLINKQNGYSYDPYDEHELVNKLKNSIKCIEGIHNTQINLRESKMPFSFNEKIDCLISSL